MPSRARHSFTTTKQDVARNLWTKPAHNECSGQSEQLSLARLKQGSSNEGPGRAEGGGEGEAIGSTFLLIASPSIHHFMLNAIKGRKEKSLSG